MALEIQKRTVLDIVDALPFGHVNLHQIKENWNYRTNPEGPEEAIDDLIEFGALANLGQDNFRTVLSD